MTEDQARQKWCPFGDDRIGLIDSDPPSLCIASDCMAWRWYDVPMDTKTRPEDLHGFCGLAGEAGGS